ncbi:uncharacterized protein CEXT_730751 [Caerostris extrusa]|uniref:Uncharacterized protein n=1 Tax=Caerostris extrusa TaxID=172846 RepID=A0AAV4SF76_CAEEX|nr:uncharacterized protein CEXT_730751 [Caerostris extrusa]
MHFLRSESSMGSVTVQLLQAKSRITPMKTITIPRLELMAATIGARLFSYVKQAPKLPNVKAYFWTDSSTVLTWIISRERWSVFVTNRISEIRKLTTSEDRFHISTEVKVNLESTRFVGNLTNPPPSPWWGGGY